MKTSPTSRAERIFTLLLRLYPRADRDEFGDPMLQHFRDLRRDAQAAGHWPTLRFWLAILLDTLASAAEARIAQTTRAVTGKKLAMNAGTIPFRKVFKAFLFPLLVGVAIYIYAQPKTFVSLARISIPYPVSNPDYIKTHIAKIDSGPVLELAMNELRLTDVFVKRAGGAGRNDPTAVAVEYLRRRVSVRQFQDTAVVEVRASSENSAEAAALANQIAASFVQIVRQNPASALMMKANLSPEENLDLKLWQISQAISLLDRAQPSLRPASPNIPRLAVMGTLLSIVLAAIGAGLLRFALRLKPDHAST